MMYTNRKGRGLKLGEVRDALGEEIMERAKELGRYSL